MMTSFVNPPKHYVSDQNNFERWRQHFPQSNPWLWLVEFHFSQPVLRFHFLLVFQIQPIRIEHIYGKTSLSIILFSPIIACEQLISLKSESLAPLAYENVALIISFWYSRILNFEINSGRGFCSRDGAIVGPEPIKWTGLPIMSDYGFTE